MPQENKPLSEELAPVPKKAGQKFIPARDVWDALGLKKPSSGGFKLFTNPLNLPMGIRGRQGYGKSKSEIYNLPPQKIQQDASEIEKFSKFPLDDQRSILFNAISGSIQDQSIRNYHNHIFGSEQEGIKDVRERFPSVGTFDTYLERLPIPIQAKAGLRDQFVKKFSYDTLVDEAATIVPKWTKEAGIDTPFWRLFEAHADQQREIFWGLGSKLPGLEESFGEWTASTAVDQLFDYYHNKEPYKLIPDDDFKKIMRAAFSQAGEKWLEPKSDTEANAWALTLGPIGLINWAAENLPVIKAGSVAGKALSKGVSKAKSLPKVARAMGRKSQKWLSIMGEMTTMGAANVPGEFSPDIEDQIQKSADPLSAKLYYRGVRFASGALGWGMFRAAEGIIGAGVFQSYGKPGQNVRINKGGKSYTVQMPGQKSFSMEMAKQFTLASAFTAIGVTEQTLDELWTLEDYDKASSILIRTATGKVTKDEVEDLARQTVLGTFVPFSVIGYFNWAGKRFPEFKEKYSKSSKEFYTRYLPKSGDLQLRYLSANSMLKMDYEVGAGKSSPVAVSKPFMGGMMSRQLREAMDNQLSKLPPKEKELVLKKLSEGTGHEKLVEDLIQKQSVEESGKEVSKTAREMSIRKDRADIREQLKAMEESTPDNQ